MDELRGFIDIVVGFGLGAIFVSALAIYLLRNPIVILKVWSFLATAIHRLFGVWKKAAIASQIEAHINSGIQQLGLEAPAAFAQALKLKWISTGEDHAVLEDGTVVVRVKDDPNLVKPLVTATLLYLRKGVIPDSRPYVGRRMLTAVDLVLAHRILVNCPRRDAVNYLTTHHVEPSLEDKQVSDYYETADLVDRAGLLTRIVLRELSGYAAKLVGRRPTRRIRSESVHFFEFVGRVANRTIEIPLTFFGNFIRCTTALIARREVYERAGLSVYQRNFRRDIDLGMHVVYLLSRGYKNIQVARHLAKWAGDEGLISGSITDRFVQPAETGELIPAECVVCFSSRVGRSVKISPVEEAQIAVSQHIPESLTGEIDIMSIAREPGTVTKILVHSDRHDDPVRLCVGRREQRRRLISSELGEEIVDFVPWSPDPRENVVEALIPLERDDVFDVWVSSDLLKAKVIVGSSAAAHRAVGTDGVNLRVAERLLGMNIKLETREAPIPSDQELQDVLTYVIPEIAEGKIEIVRTARRVGRAAKVAVRSAEVPNLRKVCVGPGGKMARAISDHLGGEQVTFVVWDPEKLEGCIYQALYPLRYKDVISVSVDAEKGQAVVTVRSGRARAMAVGRDGDNVRLAEEICQIQIEICERS